MGPAENAERESREAIDRAPTRAERKAQNAAAKAARKAEKQEAKAARSKGASPKQAASDVEAWRKGVKGRPTQVLIGFLANASKRDAIRYAVGVAERNATSFENTAYAVFRWNDGWAYEVHEGGPRRAYLPAILKFFDAQGEHARLDELVVMIATAGRFVRVERTHSGLTGFLMPEDTDSEQTEWLEPGARLKAAAPVRLGVMAAGAAVFGTGFLVLVAAIIMRPDAPVLTAQHQDVPYNHLPISQWQSLVDASSTGYVSRMQFSGGSYSFNLEQYEAPVSATPPLPAAQ